MDNYRKQKTNYTYTFLGGENLFTYQIRRLLLGSTILSSVFSLFIIIMTVVHHFTIKQHLDELREQIRKTKESTH